MLVWSNKLQGGKVFLFPSGLEESVISLNLMREECNLPKNKLYPTYGIMPLILFSPGVSILTISIDLSFLFPMLSFIIKYKKFSAEASLFSRAN